MRRLWWILGVCACDSPSSTRIIPAGDMALTDLAVVDLGLDQTVDQDPPDAQSVATFEVEPGRFNACDDRAFSLALFASERVDIEPFLSEFALPPVLAGPGEPITLTLDGVPEGSHAFTFRHDGQTYAPGIEIRVDRSAPQVDWPVAPETCIAAIPSPEITDLNAFVQRIDGGRLGCRYTQLVRARDACDRATSARRTWRIGPPVEPAVQGDADTGFRWETMADACTDNIRATLTRAGETPREYVANTPIEWPGTYTLALEVEGCGGPITYPQPIEVPAGPCDARTEPLDTPPNVRGWLQISSQRMVDLSLELSAAGWLDVAESVRQAAIILARHPGFPDRCNDTCLTAADHRLVLRYLSDATRQLAQRPHTRSARRCLTEAARVAVAAGIQGTARCEAQALMLVDAWHDADARERIQCLCAGECAPVADCADAPVLTADPDPVAFAEQRARLADGIDLRCQAADCPGLQVLIDRTRNQLQANDCAARTGLSVAELMIGRYCGGAGRFRHPGLNALAAARALWPLWPDTGTATTVAELDAAVNFCLR